MTGNRSSAMAISKPTDSQNRGVAALVASGARADLRVGLDGREATPREVVADRGDERLGETGDRARRRSSRCR